MSGKHLMTGAQLGTLIALCKDDKLSLTVRTKIDGVNITLSLFLAEALDIDFKPEDIILNIPLRDSKGKQCLYQIL